MGEQSDTKNDFKLSVSELLSSRREALERIKINVSHRNRLVDGHTNVIKELDVH